MTGSARTIRPALLMGQLRVGSRVRRIASHGGCSIACDTNLAQGDAGCFVHVVAIEFVRGDPSARLELRVDHGIAAVRRASVDQEHHVHRLPLARRQELLVDLSLAVERLHRRELELQSRDSQSRITYDHTSQSYPLSRGARAAGTSVISVNWWPQVDPSPGSHSMSATVS